MTAPLRFSASICLLREGSDGVEVLLAQRGKGARFMGGAWVFPGGVVDELDRSDAALAALDGVSDIDEAGWRAAALRELVEEAGIWLSRRPHTLSAEDRPHGAEVYARAATDGRLEAGILAYFSNWITPSNVPIRFDARFYVAIAPAGLDGIADGREMDDVQWVGAREGLARNRTDFVLPFPTRKTLEHFVALGDAAAVVEHGRSLREIRPIQPRLRISEDVLEAVLPWEPGYDDLTDDPPTPDLLARAVRVTTAEGDEIPEMSRHAD